MASRVSIVAALALAALVATSLPSVAEAQNIGCLLEHCGVQAAACALTHNCSSALNCVRKCSKDNQTCQVMCEEEHPSKAFATLSACLVDNHCMPHYPPVNCPRPAAEPFNISALSGGWWVIKGLSKAYDCDDCQNMAFHQRPSGSWAYKYSMLVEPGLERTVMCNVTQVPGQPGRLEVTYFEAGLHGQDDWYIIASDTSPGPTQWIFIHYCGQTPLWNYQGGVIVSRTFSLSADAEAAIAKAAARANLDLSQWCTIDNTPCSGQA